MLTHLSLCSGIGGLDLAAEWAGFTTVGQCEIADYPTKVLERHWPDVPRWRDIRELTSDSFYERTGLRTVDVLSAGFPCQGFSVAGKRKGKEDDRYLWPEVFRIVQELHPAWFLGENVPGIIDLALDTVLSDLEEANYEVQAFVIPACGVDAPHKRERVAILAHSKHRGGTLRWNREFQDTEEDGRGRNHNGGGTQTVLSGKRRENESGSPGMADGIRAAVYQVDSDSDIHGLQGRDINQVLERSFTICSCRERERESGTPSRGYDGLLRSLLEVTPFGRIGVMNPEYLEWMQGYPQHWTESK